MPLLAENAEYSIAEICDVQFYTHSINTDGVPLALLHAAVSAYILILFSH